MQTYTFWKSHFRLNNKDHILLLSLTSEGFSHKNKYGKTTRREEPARNWCPRAEWIRPTEDRGDANFSDPTLPSKMEVPRFQLQQKAERRG